MISGAIERLAQCHPEAPALVTAEVRWTYSQLVEAAKSIAASSVEGRFNRVGVWCKATPALLATLVALDSIGVDAVLFSAAATDDRVRTLANELGLDVVLTDREPTNSSGSTSQAMRFRAIEWSTPSGSQSVMRRNHDPQIILFTSGTSGRPKPAIHSWNTLSAGVNRDGKYAGRRWLLAYEPTSFAGIQVWLQALLTGGCLSVPESRDPAAAAQRLVTDRVEFASATPSFWRLLLVSVPRDELSQAPLKQITLGGEPIDQSILDALRASFPQSRITHIYASTEMGVCFSVSDGQAGFPVSFLNDPQLPVALRISSDGELEICSNRAMLGYLHEASRRDSLASNAHQQSSEWFATGDLVQQRGERIYFAGRKSETINVGGMKVYPTEVEQCIRQVPGVQEVRVFSVPSSITGQLVGAEIQPAAGVELDELRQQIVRLCRQRLARHQVPSSIQFREQLPVNESGKVQRREAVDHA